MILPCCKCSVTSTLWSSWTNLSRPKRRRVYAGQSRSGLVDKSKEPNWIPRSSCAFEVSWKHKRGRRRRQRRAHPLLSQPLREGGCLANVLRSSTGTMNRMYIDMKHYTTTTRSHYNSGIRAALSRPMRTRCHPRSFPTIES